MEKFNITAKTKRQVSRRVKSELIEQVKCGAGNIYFGQFAIMYNVEGYFYPTSILNIEDKEQEGEVFYKVIDCTNKMDKITLIEIEQMIFSN